MDESKADQQEPAQAAPLSAQSFKCANCAAKMEFKPGAQAQECPYCGQSNPIPQSEEDIQELDFRTYLAQQSEEEPAEEHQTISCGACGAETTVDPNVLAKECPFCDTPMVATASSKSLCCPLRSRVTRPGPLLSNGSQVCGLHLTA